MGTVSVTPRLAESLTAALYMEAADESRSARNKADSLARKLWEQATGLKLPQQAKWHDEDGRLWILEAVVRARLVPLSDRMEGERG